jgi:hypothetical protein
MSGVQSRDRGGHFTDPAFQSNVVKTRNLAILQLHGYNKPMVTDLWDTL